MRWTEGGRLPPMERDLSVVICYESAQHRSCFHGGTHEKRFRVLGGKQGSDAPAEESLAVFDSSV